MTTDTYTTPTNYTEWIVPSGVNELTVDAVAGSGGGLNPGAGGRVQAVIQVTPGDTLRLFVGEEGGYEPGVGLSHSGAPGGGTSYDSGGSGGGWTGITLDDGATALVIAGAGGGSSGTPSFVAGGDGGGLTAQAGADDSTCTGGGGGTPSAGGAAGTGGGGTNYVTPGDGAAWTSGLGSQARAGYRVNFNRSAGSGGGGWYSGGGGASDVSSSSGDRAAGGGGSSYTNPTYASGVTHTQGYNASGAGSLTITYTETGGWFGHKFLDP